MRRIFNHSFRGVYELNFETFILSFISSQGKILSRLLPESLSMEITCMIFPKFHRFFDIFDQKIQQLIIGGFVNSTRDFHKTASHKKYTQSFAELGGPQILTMEHLETGFVVWLVSISFSIITFSLECGLQMFAKCFKQTL